jgi:hypothetical protein
VGLDWERQDTVIDVGDERLGDLTRDRFKHGKIRVASTAAIGELQTYWGTNSAGEGKRSIFLRE